LQFGGDPGRGAVHHAAQPHERRVADGLRNVLVDLAAKRLRERHGKPPCWKQRNRGGVATLRRSVVAAHTSAKRRYTVARTNPSPSFSAPGPQPPPRAAGTAR